MSVWKSDETLLSICILNFSFKNDFVWEEISPDETPRSSSKILRCASYFQLSSRCFVWWWNTASHVWYITWNTLYRVWYVTSGVLISDETLLLVFDALLLGNWTSNKTLLFMLIRYPGILCQIQNSFSCLVYSFLVFGHKMNNCFSCLLDIFIFWYQVKHSFLCLIYRLIYKQNRNSFDDGKAREKD